MTIVLGILGVIVYLYLSWRTLRENYQEEDVVAFSWVGLLLFLVGGRVAFGLKNWGVWSDNPGAWLEFWRMGEFCLIGSIVLWYGFAILICQDKGWRLWSFFEDSLTSIVFLSIIAAVEIQNWPLAIALGGASLFSLLLGKKYRSFQWFKSGKKGFIFFWFFIWFWPILAAFSKIWWLASFSLLFMVGLFMLGYDKLSK